ncbi:MAG: hypothetical protein HS115_06705 [Spirochaetales bacterium]|nr:hypothetical protein [Spirochaetales bacterium]
MGLFDLFRKKSPPPEPAEPRADFKRLRRAILQARESYAKLLPGRSAEKGLLLRTDRFQLQKTGFGLYRLEAQDLSITISTESFIHNKDGKIQGLVQLSEPALARAIRGRELGLFFPAQVGSGSELLRTLLPQSHGVDLTSLMDLPVIVRETWLSRAGPALVAHVLVGHKAATIDPICENMSRRFQAMVADELELLCGPAREKLSNPHSGRFALLENDRALNEAEEILRKICRIEELRQH